MSKKIKNSDFRAEIADAGFILFLLIADFKYGVF
jgi:hypothetical protein